MEDEPVMRLELTDGEEFHATRENSFLFRFAGHLTMYDHVFFLRDEEENSGIYIFSANPVFPDIVEYMTNNGYELHLNLREVAECDQDAFNRMIEKDTAPELDAGVPEDWA